MFQARHAGSTQMITRNVYDLTKRALRNAGYEDDSNYLIHAELLGVSDKGPARLMVLALFDDSTGKVFIDLDTADNWVASY